MSKLTWDATGDRYYETGVDRGVLYPMTTTTNGTTVTESYGTGVAWNGLTSVSENPEGGEPTDIWADNMKYLSLMSAENYKATIEAYTYPDEFMECDGSKEIGSGSGMFVLQQARKKFGFCYRTRIGSDTVDANSTGNDKQYKIHIVYGLTAAPSDKSYSTISDSPEAITFSWEVSSVPTKESVNGEEYIISSIVIDTRHVTNDTYLTALEDKLYGADGTGGSNGTSATLPTPSQVYSLITSGTMS